MIILTSELEAVLGVSLSNASRIEYRASGSNNALVRMTDVKRSKQAPSERWQVFTTITDDSARCAHCVNCTGDRCFQCRACKCDKREILIDNANLSRVVADLKADMHVMSRIAFHAHAFGVVETTSTKQGFDGGSKTRVTSQSEKVVLGRKKIRTPLIVRKMTDDELTQYATTKRQN